MSKKTSILATILFLLATFLSAAAEDYTTFVGLTDLFFQNDKEPWDYHLAEVSSLEKALKFFECQTERTGHRFRHVCVSDSSKYEGRYKLTLDFDPGKNLELRVIEIAAYHPAVKWDWDNYGNIDSALRNISEFLKAKSYIGNNLNMFYSIVTERNNTFGLKEIVHTLLDKNAEVTDTFWTPKTGVTVGHNKDMVVINLASFDFYNENYYFEEFIPLFGSYRTFHPLQMQMTK